VNANIKACNVLLCGKMGQETDRVSLVTRNKLCVVSGWSLCTLFYWSYVWYLCYNMLTSVSHTLSFMLPIDLHETFSITSLACYIIYTFNKRQ